MVWNVSTQLQHPQTGQITKQYKPASEHVRVPASHLRIVSDELWDRAAARLKHLAENQNARVLGGYNRSKSGAYLYGGLLFCGICGSKMILGGIQGRGFYRCPNYRQRRGCTNNLGIREDRAAAQITNVLKHQLFVPELLSYLVSAVVRELKESWKRESQLTQGEDIAELQSARRALMQKIDNLINVIETSGTEGLTARLAAHEFEKKRIEGRLDSLKGTKKVKLTEEELHALVRGNVAALLDILKDEVPVARTVLQQHLRGLDLFPSESGTGPIFEVIGKFDLFTGPSDPEGGVLLGCLGTGTGQQYTDDGRGLSLSVSLGWSCTSGWPGGADAPFAELLESPLAELLESRPNLLHQPKLASRWAELINAVARHGSESRKRVHGNCVAWNVRNRAAYFVQRFGMVDVVIGRDTYYMFCRAGAPSDYT